MIRHVVLALALSSGLCAYGQAVIRVTPADAGTREKILSVARSLVGTTESTGHNDGAVIEEILRLAGAQKGDPYCGAFNNYCYVKAGVKSRPSVPARAASWVQNPTWTRANGGRTPLPADAWGLYWGGRIRHTGLVETWGTGKALRTIEGNTSPSSESGDQSNGDGIWKKIRLKAQIYAVQNWISGR